LKYIFIKHHRNEPDKVLLADLRKTASSHGKNHITADEYKKKGGFHLTTICSRFGSWNRALLKAGLKVKFIRQVSDDELLLNLKRVWDTLCRQPKCEDMIKPLSKYCRNAYSKHFGSWQGALLSLVKAIKAGRFKSSKKPGGIPQYTKKPIGRPKGRVFKKKHVTKSLRYDVLKRDNFKCRLCGASPTMDPKITLHADHIIPASKGGETILSNLQTLCSDCNYGKGVK